MKKKLRRERYYNLDNLPKEIIITKTETGYKVEPVEKPKKKRTTKKKGE